MEQASSRRMQTSPALLPLKQSFSILPLQEYLQRIFKNFLKQSLFSRILKESLGIFFCMCRMALTARRPCSQDPLASARRQVDARHAWCYCSLRHPVSYICTYMYGRFLFIIRSRFVLLYIFLWCKALLCTTAAGDVFSVFFVWTKPSFGFVFCDCLICNSSVICHCS